MFVIDTCTNYQIYVLFNFLPIVLHCSSVCSTVIFLSFRTDRSGQTVQTQIRLLLEEQSDQGLHCLLFHLHLLEAFLCCKANLFEFEGGCSHIFGVRKFGTSTVCLLSVSGTSFQGDLVMNTFLQPHSPSSTDSRRVVVSLWQKNVP